MKDINETLDKINATMRAEAEKNPHSRAFHELRRAAAPASMTIREARLKKDMTQAELADAVGTTQSVISRLEDNGYAGHTMRTLERIAEALDLRLEIRLKPKASGFLWAPPKGRNLPSRN